MTGRIVRSRKTERIRETHCCLSYSHNNSMMIELLNIHLQTNPALQQNIEEEVLIQTYFWVRELGVRTTPCKKLTNQRRTNTKNPPSEPASSGGKCWVQSRTFWGGVLHCPVFMLCNVVMRNVLKLTNVTLRRGEGKRRELSSVICVILNTQQPTQWNKYCLAGRERALKRPSVLTQN